MRHHHGWGHEQDEDVTLKGCTVDWNPAPWRACAALLAACAREGHCHGCLRRRFGTTGKGIVGAEAPWVHNFLLLGRKNEKLLQMDTFFSSYIYLESWQISNFRNKI